MMPWIQFLKIVALQFGNVVLCGEMGWCLFFCQHSLFERSMPNVTYALLPFSRVPWRIEEASARMAVWLMKLDRGSL